MQSPAKCSLQQPAFLLCNYRHFYSATIKLDVLGYEKIKLVMDRGYYSAENVNALFKKHIKFLCGTSSALGFAKEYIREIGSKKDHYEYYKRCEDQ